MRNKNNFAYVFKIGNAHIPSVLLMALTSKVFVWKVGATKYVGKRLTQIKPFKLIARGEWLELQDKIFELSISDFLVL